MQKRIKKPLYDKKMIWIQVGIGLAIILIHLSVYAFSILENSRVANATQQITQLMSNFVPGAIGYEGRNKPYQIPYLQMLTSLIFTAPLVFLAIKKVAQYDVNLIDGPDGVFNLKVVWTFMLATGVVILLTPPLGIGGMPDKSYYGVLAPFKYAITAFVIGYSARVLITSKQDKARNA